MGVLNKVASECTFGHIVYVFKILFQYLFGFSFFFSFQHTHTLMSVNVHVQIDSSSEPKPDTQFYFSDLMSAHVVMCENSYLVQKEMCISINVLYLPERATVTHNIYHHQKHQYKYEHSYNCLPDLNLKGCIRYRLGSQIRSMIIHSVSFTACT